jgi:hypothetical protein
LRHVEADDAPDAISAFIMRGNVKRIANMNSSKLLVASLIGAVTLSLAVSAFERSAGVGANGAAAAQYNVSSSSQGSAQVDCGGQCP